MSNLEELQTRLEIFRDAGQNLQIDPLVTQKDLARLGVAYQTELIDELEQAIEDNPAPDNKLIFTGHTGCGKSTLLAELGFRLMETGRYFVVRYSIADTIERSAVDHVNILFSMALELIEKAEKRSIRLNAGTKREFYEWLGKHTQTKTQDVVKEIELNAEATAKGGIPLLLEFITNVKSKLRVSSVIRQEISTEFARRTSDLVAQIDRLQSYIENATGQKVLVIIDDLDKLELSTTEIIFSKNIKSLIDPNLAIIYTLPIATLREVPIKNSITKYINQIHTMRVTKFYSKADVRKSDRFPDKDCVSVFAEILRRRLPLNSSDSDTELKIILFSGGLLRELIRIADRCCNRVKLELRGQIKRQQWDAPEVKIDRRILNDVITELRLERSEVLGRVDYEMLLAIYNDFQPQDTQNQRFLDLLHGLYILEYRNAKLWYDLNPIVRDLLIEEGLIS
jgi:energy-coupling factor transporter ATP-binding protein EcfA2